MDRIKLLFARLKGLPAFDKTSHKKELLDYARLGLFVLAVIAVLIYFAISNTRHPITGVKYQVEKPFSLPTIAICTYLPFDYTIINDYSING